MLYIHGMMCSVMHMNEQKMKFCGGPMQRKLQESTKMEMRFN